MPMPITFAAAKPAASVARTPPSTVLSFMPPMIRFFAAPGSFTSAELVASMLPGTSRVFRAENRMWSFGMPASSSALTEPSVRFLPVSSSL
ncbi:hypothetical protein D3C84_788190 [compost metagenome]